MTHLVIPESDGERVSVLETLLESLYPVPGDASEDPEAGAQDPPRYLGEMLPPNLIADLQRLTVRTRAAHTDLVLAMGAWRAAVAEAQAAGERLACCVCDMWQAVVRRSRRLDLPPEVVEAYQVPAEHMRNRRGSRRLWLFRARALLGNMAVAEAMGAPPLGEPTAEELQGYMARAEAAFKALGIMGERLKNRQNAMDVYRRDTTALYRRLAGCARIGMVDLTPGTRRDYMRAMGFRFRPRSRPRKPLQPAEPTSTVARRPT